MGWQQTEHNPFPQSEVKGQVDSVTHMHELDPPTQTPKSVLEDKLHSRKIKHNTQQALIQTPVVMTAGSVCLSCHSPEGLLTW